MRAYRRFLWAAATTAVTGCAPDAGPPAAPTLQRLILSPASASLAIGGTQRFAVTGRLSDGRSAAVAVAYAATGGTITPEGLFTAGGATGVFRVIALQSGGALADSSDVVVTLAGAHNYTTIFPLTENPISEGGRWLNGGAVGLDWTNVSTTPGLAVGHQVGASYTDGTAILTGPWGADQRVTAAVHSTNQKDACYQEVELRLRSALSAHVSTGYEVGYKVSTTQGAYLIIVRWNGALGDFTYLFKGSGAQYGVTDGDVVSASVAGRAVTAYKNGVKLATATDSTFSAGAPGMGFNLENGPAGCPGTNGDYGFTSFTATDGATGP